MPAALYAWAGRRVGQVWRHCVRIGRTPGTTNTPMKGDAPSVQLGSKALAYVFEAPPACVPECGGTMGAGVAHG